MTTQTGTGIIGTIRALPDGRGAARVEDVFDTGIEDLWEACTDPDRLARWIGRVTGDRSELRVGGTVEVVFTSTWEGQVRIEECEAPHHLLLTSAPGTDEETQTEVWLAAEGSRTRLVVEERGLPTEGLHYYGSGWQAHVEDLRAFLATGGAVHPDGWSAQTPAPAWHARWTELTPAYESRGVGAAG